MCMYVPDQSMQAIVGSRFVGRVSESEECNHILCFSHSCPLKAAFFQSKHHSHKASQILIFFFVLHTVYNVTVYSISVSVMIHSIPIEIVGQTSCWSSCISSCCCIHCTPCFHLFPIIAPTPYEIVGSIHRYPVSRTKIMFLKAKAHYYLHNTNYSKIVYFLMVKSC